MHGVRVFPGPPDTLVGSDSGKTMLAGGRVNPLRLNVARLAAVDMHGTSGTRFRQRAILVEFLIGAVAGLALGIWILSTAPQAGWLAFGAWLIGIALNYVPLALYAISLSRPGRLDAALAGVDIGQELRTYTALQFWVFVPLLLVGLAIWQWWQQRQRSQ